MQGDVVLGPLDCDTLDHCAEQYILKKDKKESLFASDGTQITDYIYDDISITYDPLICVRVKQTIPDFRQTSWGMSESDVRALEGNSPDYTGTLSGNGAKYIGYDARADGPTTLLSHSILGRMACIPHATSGKKSTATKTCSSPIITA